MTEPIGIIQVGVGGMGSVWVETVQNAQAVTHVALVDTNAEVLRAQAQRCGLDASHCYTGLAAALQRESADALINVTPPQFHEAVCCQALEAGLSVLTEKPLSDTMAAARRIVAAAQRTDKTLMVAQNYRYQAFAPTLRRLVSSGEMGAPGQVHVAFAKGPHFGGFREEMDHPLIVDMAIHHFDMLRYFLGADPVAVSGRSWNPSWSWFGGDASTALQFAFEGNIHASYTGSWCSTGAETSWNADWRIECEKGVYLASRDLLYRAPTGEELQPVDLDPMPLARQDYLLEAFRLAITEGAPPETTGKDNLKSLGMVFGAVRAVSTGENVPLPLAD
mgnify:FL=1